jgi:protein SCO1/2
MEEGMVYWEQKIAQMSRIAFSLLINLAVVGLQFSCNQKKEVDTLPFYNTPDFDPIFISIVGQENEIIDHQIADFSLTDQLGGTISQTSIDDKIHIANFMFTSCGSICPVMTNQLKVIEEKFRSNPNFLILSYSVTPWIDDVAKLKEYAINNDIKGSNWHFLTGSKSEIYTLARQSYFAEEDLGFTKDSTEFLHTEHVLLVDQSKRIRGIYNGTLRLDIEQLADDIQVLLDEIKKQAE